MNTYAEILTRYFRYSFSGITFFLFFIIPVVFNTTVAEGDLENKSSSFLTLNKDKLFAPVVSLETWSVMSFNDDANSDNTKNRFNTMFRRLRFGASGQPYSWMKYSFQLHFDRLGQDPNSSLKGSYSGCDIWNAYLTFKLLSKSELLNLHVGYFWTAISREFHTSPWAVSSLDKAYSTWYLRKFLTCKGPGIENGIALGGLHKFSDFFSFSYRTGVYYPEKHSSATCRNPLCTCRLTFDLFSPEQEKYNYMVSGNKWNKRNGITLGFGVAHQGKTDNQLTGSSLVCFDKSTSYGTDLLVNYESLTVDGEYYIMKRSASSFDDYTGEEWHLRFAYNFLVNTTFLEPVFMLARYDGYGEKQLFKYIGDDITYDLGVNWYMNKDKLKLFMHYILQDGKAASNTGDYLCVGFQFRT